MRRMVLFKYVFRVFSLESKYYNAIIKKYQAVLDNMDILHSRFNILVVNKKKKFLIKILVIMIF